MRAPLLILLLLLLVNTAVDFYIYRRARNCHNTVWRKAQLAAAIVGFIALVIAIALPARSGSEAMLLTKMWLLFAYLTIYVPKYLGMIVDMIAAIPILIKRKRVTTITRTGIALSIALFAAMWWGALINRYNLQVNHVTIEIDNLPSSFNGLTIAQFSDLHTGTFGTDTTFVSRIVDTINNLKPDIIVFTGDLVNRQSDEAIPFISTLSRLHAPHGVYAILGNHDYGDYREWASQAEKQDNMNLLYDIYKKTGIELLLNKHRWIRNASDSIALIGVENIGDPPFKIYGSLAASYPDLSDNNTKILLSHNPQHWVDSIASGPSLKRQKTNIQLTLSGHTHAIQIAVGRLSPAFFRYATWGGLYTDNACGSHESKQHITYAGNKTPLPESKKLYVNIGAGTVGMPMRLGATPEITMITLTTAKRPTSHSKN